MLKPEVVEHLTVDEIGAYACASKSSLDEVETASRPTRRARSVRWNLSPRLLSSRSRTLSAEDFVRQSTPETPSKSLLLAFGLDDDEAPGDGLSEPSRPTREAQSRWRRGAVAIGLALLVAMLGLARRDAPVRREPLPALPDAAPPALPIVETARDIHSAYKNCSMVTPRPLRISCAARRLFSRLKHIFLKHALKLAVLLSFGFSPIPFALSFI